MLTSIMLPAGTNLDEVWRLTPEHIPYFWSSLSQLIVENPDDLPYFYDPETIRTYLLDGKLDAWVGMDKTEVKIAALLSFETYPLRSEYNFIWIGGKNWARFMPGSLKKIESYAYSIGAEAVVVTGRAGWVRRLKPYGYVSRKIILRKSLIKTLGH